MKGDLSAEVFIKDLQENILKLVPHKSSYQKIAINVMKLQVHQTLLHLRNGMQASKIDNKNMFVCLPRVQTLISLLQNNKIVQNTRKLSPEQTLSTLA